MSSEPTSSHQSWIGFAAFAAFTCLIALLYIKQKGEWENSSIHNTTQADSLSGLTNLLQERVAKLEEAESMRTKSIYENTFDPFDSDNFRIYGLYRDMTRSKKELDVAMMFHISNSGAIKAMDVMGERWFIVPVKGVHFMLPDETATKIATLYYDNPKDSTLILRFNLDPQPGKNIFIPFNQ